MTSTPVWALIVTLIASSFAFSLIKTEAQIYLSTIHHFSLASVNILKNSCVKIAHLRLAFGFC